MAKASRLWHLLTVGIGVVVGVATFGFGAPISTALIACGATALAGSLTFEVVRSEMHVSEVETQNKADHKLIERLEKKLEEMEVAGENKDAKIAELEKFKAATEAELRAVRKATDDLAKRAKAQQNAQVEIRADIASIKPPVVTNNPPIPSAARRPERL